MIPIYNSTQVATSIKHSPVGPIAKINGVWYSVNGNVNEIIDVRYALSPSELIEFRVRNDQAAH